MCVARESVGVWRNLAAHVLWEHEVAGSSPATPTTTALRAPTDPRAEGARPRGSAHRDSIERVSVVDAAAPVHVRSVLAVRAAPEAVWAVIADVPRWPTWNPGILDCILEGDLEPGAALRWSSSAGPTRARLTAVEPPRLLAWASRSLGARTAVAWRIEPADAGAQVTAEGSVSGIAARVLAGRRRERTKAMLEAWLRLLALEAEHPPPG
jgi:hypothetical protein